MMKNPRDEKRLLNLQPYKKKKDSDKNPTTEFPEANWLPIFMEISGNGFMHIRVNCYCNS